MRRATRLPIVAAAALLALLLAGALTVAASTRSGPSRPAPPVVPTAAPGWIAPLLAKHERAGRLRRAVDVTDFGAKGDGSDDWAAINAAVRALPARDAVLYFPPARVRYSLGGHARGIDLYGKEDVRIEGDGWRSTIALGGQGDPRVAFVFANAGDGLSFDGVGIDCGGGPNTIGIHVAGDRVTVQRSYVTGCLGGGVWIGSRREISIRDNYFYGAGYGVLTEETGSATRIDVSGNSFDGADVGAGNGADAIEINSPRGGQSEIEISGNRIANYTNLERSGFGIGLAHVTGARIVGNDVRGCGLACIHIEDGASHVFVSGNVIGDFRGDGIQVISGAGRVVHDVAIVRNTIVGCGCRSGPTPVTLGGVAGAERVAIAGNTLLTCGRPGPRGFEVDTGYAPVDVTVSGNVVRDAPARSIPARCRRTRDR